MRGLLSRAGVCFLLTALLIISSGAAESMHQEISHPDIQMSVVVGYEGNMTYGKAMPVCIRLENSGGDLAGKVAINTYRNRKTYDRYEVDVFLAGGAVKEVMIPVMVQSKQEIFTAELICEGETICAVNAVPDTLVNPNALLIGVLSPEPENLSYMNITMENDELLRSEYAQTIPLTQSTFPDTMELMNSFGMLVVDGFDANTLSAEQKQTMMQWLEDGHILLVGGGAQAGVTYPFFSEISGIVPGKAMQRQALSALASYLEIRMETEEKQVLLSGATGGEALISLEEETGNIPILWRSQAGAGVLYTAAFAWGDKPIAAWPVMHTFWQRLLLKDQPALYQSAFQNNDYTYHISYLTSRIPVENTSGMLAAVLILGAGLAVAAAGAYILLKRLDKRQYLWLALPVITVLCTGAVCFLAEKSEINEPLAISIASFRQDAEGNRNDQYMVSVATADQGEHLVTVKEGTILPQDTNSYYYYGEDEKKTAEPTELHYRYVCGENSGVGLEFKSAWDEKRFSIADVPEDGGNIESAIWREEDGMHGYVTNHTGLQLSEGAIVSRYGYCSVPALQAGETYEFTLLSAEFADPQKPVYEDGSMYESLAGGYADLYTIIDEYFYQTSRLKEGESRNRTEESELKSDMMMGVVNQDYDQMNGYYTSIFHYLSFCEDLPEIQVFLDGEAIARHYSRGIVSAVLKFNSVGATGVVYHTPGMDTAVRCQVGSDGRPYQDPAVAVNKGYYHRLSENPAFVFDLSGLEEAEIERMILYSETYLRYARMYVYDGENWMEQKLGEEIEEPGKFVSEDGKLYVQFRADASAEEYMEVYTPTLLLEGRMKSCSQFRD